MDEAPPQKPPPPPPPLHVHTKKLGGGGSKNNPEREKDDAQPGKRGHKDLHQARPPEAWELLELLDRPRDVVPHEFCPEDAIRCRADPVHQSKELLAPVHSVLERQGAVLPKGGPR